MKRRSEVLVRKKNRQEEGEKKLPTLTNFIPDRSQDGSSPGKAFPDPEASPMDLDFLTGLRSSGPESESLVESFLERFLSGFGILAETKSSSKRKARIGTGRA